MLQASFRIKNKLSTLTGNDTEMDPAMSPHKVKGDWTRCLKSLEKFKLPASCATATAIYANCRILLDTKLGIVPLMIDHGEIDFSLVNDFTETLDFVAATLHWPKVFRNCLKRMLEAHPGVFEQNEGDKVSFVISQVKVNTLRGTKTWRPLGKWLYRVLVPSGLPVD